MKRALLKLSLAVALAAASLAIPADRSARAEGLCCATCSNGSSLCCSGAVCLATDGSGCSGSDEEFPKRCPS